MASINGGNVPPRRGNRKAATATLEATKVPEHNIGNAADEHHIGKAVESANAPKSA